MPRKWPIFQTAVETGGSRHLVCTDTKRVSDSLLTTELQLDAAAAVRASNAGTPARSVPGNRSTVAIAAPVRIGLDRNPLGDAAVEADEAYVNAGEKRHPARRPGRPAAAAGQRPPRPRDVRQRPAPSGRVVGRDSGEARLEVVDRADGATLEEVVQCATLEGTTVYTDEWRGYTGLAGLRWGHVAVSQAGPRRSSKSCPPAMAVSGSGWPAPGRRWQPPPAAAAPGHPPPLSPAWPTMR